MPKQLENLPIRRNLPLLLILDLRQHDRKFPLHLVRPQVFADPLELAARLFDLPAPDQMARRVGHEADQPEEHDHAPRDLDAQG